MMRSLSNTAAAAATAGSSSRAWLAARPAGASFASAPVAPCPSAPLQRASAQVRSKSTSASISSVSPASHAAATATAVAADPSAYAKLEAQFRALVPRSPEGLDALQQLHAMAAAAAPAPAPSSVLRHSLRALPYPRVILIGGDQCTGKSTLSKRLASLLHGRAFSAGELFRQKAKQLGISNAELSRRALEDPAIDVGIEFELCKLILTGGANGPLVVEGRQPGVMEAYCRTRLGKGASFNLRLTCSVREQALRFIERESGLEMLALASGALPAHLRALRDAAPHLRTIVHPDVERICALFDDNDGRDEDDRRRFTALYGDSPIMDYRNPSLYDCLIDTTHNQSSDTFRQTIAELSKRCTLPPAPNSKL